MKVQTKLDKFDVAFLFLSLLTPYRLWFPFQIFKKKSTMEKFVGRKICSVFHLYRSLLVSVQNKLAVKEKEWEKKLTSWTKVQEINISNDLNFAHQTCFPLLYSLCVIFINFFSLSAPAFWLNDSFLMIYCKCYEKYVLWFDWSGIFNMEAKNIVARALLGGEWVFHIKVPFDCYTLGL